LAHTTIYRSGKYTTMPRLSLYRPEKGNDYKFIDKNIWEMFQVGGTDVLIHKYVGPKSAPALETTPTTPEYQGGPAETQIQDLLFLENRDRKYDPDVYILRGVYNIQDLDFNLSQFGLFLQNDTIFITFHINDTVEKIGRKLISGDVIELPHLKDDFALNDLNFALKRFYVIEDVTRAAEGFSATWYPHLYRAKCKPLVDSQEFKDILDGVAGEGTNQTLRDVMSTYEREMQITQAVLDQAEADAPLSGYDTSSFYTLQVNDEGKPELVTVDTEVVAATNSQIDVSMVLKTADRLGYDGYLLGQDSSPNGAPFTSGLAFPVNAQEGQYHLRTDYTPKRLFRYNGKYWVRVEDVSRTTMSNLGPTDTQSGDRFEGYNVRNTQKAGFINNTNSSNINGKEVAEKQSLSKALRPKADN
jgi:hypothetical protein